MAIRDIFKISRKTFFNPKEWINWDNVQGQTLTLWQILRRLFLPARAARREESYAEALVRLKLSDTTAQIRAMRYRQFALIFLSCAFLALLFAIYCLFYISWHDFFISMAVVGLLAAYGFRYDFWAFQIRQRKLGCTFADWRAYYLKRV